MLVLLFIEYLTECLDYQTEPDFQDFGLWLQHR